MLRQHPRHQQRYARDAISQRVNWKIFFYLPNTGLCTVTSSVECICFCTHSCTHLRQSWQANGNWTADNCLVNYDNEGNYFRAEQCVDRVASGLGTIQANMSSQIRIASPYGLCTGFCGRPVCKQTIYELVSTHALQERTSSSTMSKRLAQIYPELTNKLY